MGKRSMKNAAGEPDTKPEDAPEAQPETVEEGEVSGKDSVEVKFRDHRGEVTSRTFSKDVHGKEFKSLADEFRKKHAARIVA